MSEILLNIRKGFWVLQSALLVALFVASVAVTMFITHAYMFKNVCTFPVKIFGGEVFALLVAAFVGGLALAIANPNYDAKGLLGIVAISVFLTYLIIFAIIALPQVVYQFEVSADFWYGNIGKIFLTLPVLAFGEFASVFLYRVLTGE
ncbi:MAG: hypothetical protein N3F63_03430 [Thermoplasmata archaeon]|nr:hypothetical protein [Thermoplasmata archaeon]